MDDSEVGLVSGKRLEAIGQVVVDASLLPEGEEEQVATVAFRLRNTAEGWRIFAFAKPSSALARRFDLESLDGQPVWRIRREGDDLPTTSARAIALVVLDEGDLVPDPAEYSRGRLDRYQGRRIGFLDGPALPATTERLRTWLAADPGSIELRLTPGEGCTIQDVFHAVDALFEAGVVHLSLVPGL